MKNNGTLITEAYKRHAILFDDETSATEGDLEDYWDVEDVRPDTQLDQ